MIRKEAISYKVFRRRGVAAVAEIGTLVVVKRWIGKIVLGTERLFGRRIRPRNINALSAAFRHSIECPVRCPTWSVVIAKLRNNRRQPDRQGKQTRRATSSPKGRSSTPSSRRRMSRSAHIIQRSRVSWRPPHVIPGAIQATPDLRRIK